jgi:hypothetical protein
VFRDLDDQPHLHPLFVGEPNPPLFRVILEQMILFYYESRYPPSFGS